MKECNKVFFGEKGLTQTSANHLANIAKETVESNRQALDSVGFVTTSISLLGGGGSKTITQGRSQSFLDNVPTLLSEIASMNAFCAWVREAIKAREEELTIISNYNCEEYAKEICNVEIQVPVKERSMTMDDAIATLNIAERMEYFRLEAEAAAIGKYIHPMCAFANARKKLMSIVANPTRVEGVGHDTIVYESVPSASSDAVDKTFFDLQSKHRELSAQLNKIKFKLERLVQDDAIRVNKDYEVALAKYRNEMLQYTSACNTWKEEERKKLLELKIVIPKELQATYELLTKISNPR